MRPKTKLASVLVAQIIGHRTGVGPCALRPHLQRTRIVDVGDRTASGTNCMDIDHGDTRGQAADLALGGVLGDATLYQRDIRAGPAHIIGDDILEAGRLGDIDGSHNTGAWAGQSGLNRGLNGGRDRHYAAVGLGDIGLDLYANLADAFLKIVDVHLHSGPQIGVDDGGTQTLELTKFRENGG